MADVLRPPHQHRNGGLVGHHAAINPDIGNPGFRILGHAAGEGEDIAPAIDAVPMRRGKIGEIDRVAFDDVFLDRTSGNDVGRHMFVEDVAANLHQFARMGVHGQPKHHAQAPIAGKAQAEQAAAAAVRFVVILDVVEQQCGAIARALGQPHYRTEFDIPVDLGIDFLDLACILKGGDPTA